MKTEPEKGQVSREIQAFHKKHKAIPTRRAIGEALNKKARRLFGSWDAAVYASLGVHVRYRRLASEELLDRIKMFFEKNGRTPTKGDLGPTFANVCAKRFGSWSQAVTKATGVNGIRSKHRSDEDLLDELKTVHGRLGRIPTMNDVRSLGRILWTRFGSIHDALEQAIGTSERVEIFKAIVELTPPGCDVASSQEIAEALKRRNVHLSGRTTGVILQDQMKKGFVIRSVYGTAACWRLTKAGYGFLKRVCHG